MRKILFIIIASLSILCSCITDESIERLYLLRNESGVDIEMRFFSSYVYWSSYSIDLPNGEEWGKVGEYHKPNIYPVLVFEADSIAVIFNEERVIQYPDAMNASNDLLHNDAYDKISNEKYEYVFDSVDYNRAEQLVSE
jgi:hypothetical protein